MDPFSDNSLICSQALLSSFSSCAVLFSRLPLILLSNSRAVEALVPVWLALVSSARRAISSYKKINARFWVSSPCVVPRLSLENKMNRALSLLRSKKGLKKEVKKPFLIRVRALPHLFLVKVHLNLYFPGLLALTDSPRSDALRRISLVHARSHCACPQLASHTWPINTKIHKDN